MATKPTSPNPAPPTILSRSRNKLVLFFSLILVTVLIFIQTHQPLKVTNLPPSVSLLASCPWQPEVYRRPQLFLPQKPANAVIIPHHLLAAPLIHRTLSQIDPTDIKTVILVGPNHFNQGIPDIQTTSDFWHTPFGQVAADISGIDELISHNLATPIDNTFLTEHSICGLVGFLPIYFPSAKIIPLVFRSTTSSESIAHIATSLATTCDHCLLIASVDFTHDQSSKTAKSNDVKSAQILTSLNLDLISEVVADSPPSLRLVVDYVHLRQGQPGRLIDLQDSNTYSKVQPPTVTSYVSIVYSR